MKKFLFSISLLFALALQTQAQLQATIKPGSAPNSVYITFRSTTTLTAAKFSTVQFAVAVPASVTPTLTATVSSLDPFIAYAPVLVTTETFAGTNYTTYAFNGDGNQANPGVTFAAGVENNYAEVFFTGGNVVLNDVRLLQIPGGGSNNNLVNFYVANAGIDVTNVSAQFYSSVAANVSNDGNGYDGNSYVTVGAIVVPVKFLAFDLIRKDNNALLNWAVENEASITKEYEIQRGVNGVDFSTIARVSPKNNGNTGNTYQYTDANITNIRSTGIIYYRIRQVDKDGKSVVTPIAKLRLTGKGLVLQVSPNPVKNIANISLDLPEDANVKVSITDANGKQVQTIPMQLVRGVNIRRVNMDNLPAGNYTMQVNTGTEVKTFPLVKVN